MLGLIIIFTEDGGLSVRCTNLGRKQKVIYEGDFSEWNIKPILNKYGNCVRVCYTGSRIISVSIAEVPLLVKEITDSSDFLWTIMEGQQKLLFININDIGDVRLRLGKAKLVIVQESLGESLADISFPTLNITELPDEKLFKVLLHKLKESILIVAVAVLVLTFASYCISAVWEKRNSELLAEIAEKKNEAVKFDDKMRNLNRLYSKMSVAAAQEAIYTFDKIVLSLPSEIRLTSVVVQEHSLIVEGTFISSDALTELMKSIIQKEYVEDIEASRIDTDSKGNRVFTLKVWLR